MDEVSLAFDEKKRIVPILTRQCNVPFRLRRLQYVDFTTGYDVGLAALVGALKSQDQAGREHPTTSDDTAPVSNERPSGFAEPSLSAMRVDLRAPGARARFPLKVAVLGLILVVAGVGLAFVPGLLNRTPSRDVQPRPPAQGPGDFRREKNGQLLCRRVGEHRSRNPGNHKAEHQSRRTESVRQSLGQMPSDRLRMGRGPGNSV